MHGEPPRACTPAQCESSRDGPLVSGDGGAGRSVLFALRVLGIVCDFGRHARRSGGGAAFAVDLAVVSQPHRDQVMKTNAGPIGHFDTAAQRNPRPSKDAVVSQSTIANLCFPSAAELRFGRGQGGIDFQSRIGNIRKAAVALPF